MSIIINTFKDLYSCQIEIIKELTDIKGTVAVSHRNKGASRGDLPVYNTISSTKINIIILLESTQTLHGTTLLPHVRTS